MCVFCRTGASSELELQQQNSQRYAHARDRGGAGEAFRRYGRRQTHALPAHEGTGSSSSSSLFLFVLVLLCAFFYSYCMTVNSCLFSPWLLLYCIFSVTLVWFGLVWCGLVLSGLTCCGLVWYRLYGLVWSITGGQSRPSRGTSVLCTTIV